MLCLGRNSEFPELAVDILHICADTLIYDSIVMIAEFLSLRRHCAEKRMARVNKVLAFVIYVFIDEEVLLLGTYHRDDTLCPAVAEHFYKSE